MGEIEYIGWGDRVPHAELMELLHSAFQMDPAKNGFSQLHPAAYLPEYRPQARNLVIRKDGILTAAVGVFPRRFRVGETELTTYGIGNVAVRENYRAEGQMQKLMQLALEHIASQDAELSDLGGYRRRYLHFGYEVGAAPYSFRMTRKSVRSIFPDGPAEPVEFRTPEGPDDPLWDEIYAVYLEKKCRLCRDRAAFPDCMAAYGDKTAAILKNGRVTGYFVGELRELSLRVPEELGEILYRFLQDRNDIIFSVMPWEKELLAAAEEICDDASVTERYKYLVFHFRKVTEAFFRLKASYARPADGSLSFLIHGKYGDEAFALEAGNGEVSSRELREDEKAELELEHAEAERFFFGTFAAKRLEIPLAQAWFPLPLCMEKTDHI